MILRIFLASAGEEPDPVVVDDEGATARRLRILLVENDSDRFLEMSLRELGHEIVAATDAATALAHLDGSFVINEINTLPGFTPISMYPRLWEVSGLPYAALLDRLIDLAVERHERRTARAGRQR